MRCDQERAALADAPRLSQRRPTVFSRLTQRYLEYLLGNKETVREPQTSAMGRSMEAAEFGSLRHGKTMLELSSVSSSPSLASDLQHGIPSTASTATGTTSPATFGGRPLLSSLRIVVTLTTSSGLVRLIAADTSGLPDRNTAPGPQKYASIGEVFTSAVLGPLTKPSLRESVLRSVIEVASRRPISITPSGSG
jgi:hypothetical protein